METIRAHFNHGANYQALLLNLFFWLAVDDDATTTEAIVPSLCRFLGSDRIGLPSARMEA